MESWWPEVAKVVGPSTATFLLVLAAGARGMWVFGHVHTQMVERLERELVKAQEQRDKEIDRLQRKLDAAEERFTHLLLERLGRHLDHDADRERMRSRDRHRGQGGQARREPPP